MIKKVRSTKSRQSKSLDPLLFELMEKEPTKGDLRKASLIEAAISAIAEDGIENASYDRIGKALKMRRSHVAYYFKTKDELLMMVMKYIIGVSQRITVEHLKVASTSIEKLTAINSAAFEWARRFPDQVAVYLVFYMVCGTKPEFRKFFSEFREVALERLTILIDDIQSRSASAQAGTANHIRGFILGNIFEYYAAGLVSENKDFKALEKSTLSEVLRIAKSNP